MHRYEDNIKMYHKEIVCKCLTGSPAQGRIHLTGCCTDGNTFLVKLLTKDYPPYVR
jgi:hypothetical protein